MKADSIDAAQWFEQSKPFLTYVAEWTASLPALPLTSVVEGRPDRAAVMCVDMTNGFCYAGALASPRVAALVAPIVSLFKRAHELGMRHLILINDTHEPGALEFNSYPPHCLRGSAESEPVPEFKALPFFDEFVIIPKNTIDCSLGTALDPWLDGHPEVDRFIVVGDCTDICIYQLAMHLRLRANSLGRPARVIVPVDSVDTYDLPVPAARSSGAVPHAGDLLHRMFLYHMRLNGIEVISTLA